MNEMHENLVLYLNSNSFQIDQSAKFISYQLYFITDIEKSYCINEIDLSMRQTVINNNNNNGKNAAPPLAAHSSI